MARMSDYTVRKCTDGLFRAFPKGMTLPRPKTLIPPEKWEGEKGFKTRGDSLDDLRGYSYRGNK